MNSPRATILLLAAGILCAGYGELRLRLRDPGPRRLELAEIEALESPEALRVRTQGRLAPLEPCRTARGAGLWLPLADPAGDRTVLAFLRVEGPEEARRLRSAGAQVSVAGRARRPDGADWKALHAWFLRTGARPTPGMRIIEPRGTPQRPALSLVVLLSGGAAALMALAALLRLAGRVSSRAGTRSPAGCPR